MASFLSKHPRVAAVVVCFVLFGGTFALFSRSLHAGFVNYDDPSYVTDNVHVQQGLSWSGVRWAFTAPTDYWHPLTWLSHMLDWQLYGAAPAGHHATSVLWHALNAVLVCLLFRRLAGGFWRAAIAAALFAWHPLRVESVTWITERKDVISGCWFLLTVLAYLSYAERRRAGAPWRLRYVGMVTCFVAGLMSKPLLVATPVLLVLLDAWPLRRWRNRAEIRASVLDKLPLVGLSAAVSVVTLALQQRAGAFVLPLPFSARLANAVVSLVRYVGKFAWPTDLVVCYPHPGHWPLWIVTSATVVVLAAAVGAGKTWRQQPWIAIGLGWFMIMLLPVLGLVQAGFQAMADRYTYLSSLGLELALLWSLPTPTRTRGGRVLAGVVASVVLGACAVLTWKQQAVWQDSVTLFRHAVAATDGNGVAEDFLASALVAAGQPEAAAQHAERAHTLEPQSDTPLITLGSLSEHAGRLEEAAGFYRQALALRPNNPLVEMQLGTLELRLGHPDAARTLMLPPLRTAPALRERTRELGRVALRAGNAPVARFVYGLLLDATPDDVDAHVSLGYVLLRSGEREAGLEHWRRALALDPKYPGLREQLAAAEAR